jgi:hypothetical protein
MNWNKQPFPPNLNTQNEVKELFSSFDFIICTGREASILAFCNIRINLYIPFGGDIYSLPFKSHEYSFFKFFLHLILPTRSIKQVNKGTPEKYLHKAISESRNIMMEMTNSEYEKYVNVFVGSSDAEKRIFLTPPFVYHKEIELVNDGIGISWANYMEKLRVNNDFLVLYHGRQEWSTEGDISFISAGDNMSKNVHHLIIGFDKFINQKDSKEKALLILIEHGSCVTQSKKLIENLGLVENVFWLPVMPRKSILYLISLVDLCCGEFGQSFFTFGTIVEAMLMGKPVLHYREDKLYVDSYPELYPMYNAREIEEITAQLLFCFRNKSELIQTGNAAKLWVEENLINKSIDKIVSLIES